jgi:enoyl-CoA hydratase/carnithine racemase
MPGRRRLTRHHHTGSAGADLRDTQPWTEVSKTLVERREWAAICDKLCAAWEAMPHMTIASMERYAVGGGLARSPAWD